MGGCNGWVQCGVRERGRGHQGRAFWANSNARIDTAQSNQYPCYPVNHQHVLFEHVCCHCSGPRQRYVPGCVGVSGNSQKRHQSNPRLPVYLGFNPQRRAPAAICSVFIDIYKFYVAGFPLCALVTACCGCLETAAYPPPPRAWHTLLT
jgi:hypothetical protein